MDYFVLLWMLEFLVTVTVSESRMQIDKLDQTGIDNVRARDRIQYRAGDIILGAAMQVTWGDENGNCVEENTGMQLVESVNMIIDKVNADDTILPGVELGTLMIDTCSSESHALQRVIMDILPLAGGWEECLGNCSDMEDAPILAGILGASLSSVSMQLARILQVFRIPQVSYWSTSVELSDKTRFKYFFRSVPPDLYQVNAMISFVMEREWNFISVIYDDDNYGVDGFTEIVRVAEQNDICIAMSKALPRNGEDVDMILIVEELLAKKQSRVVIIFTVGANAEKLLKAAVSIPEAIESFVWIGSDGWTGVIPRDSKDRSYLDSLDGVIGFTPKIPPTPRIEEYMTNLTLEQNYGMNMSRNPWFADHISRENNCTLPGELSTNPARRVCRMNQSIDPATFRTHSIPISDAVYAFVYALDAYHRDKCGGRRGLCEEMRQMAGTNRVAKELLHYLKNVSFTSESGEIFQFDENHDGPPIYDAYVFSKKETENSENVLNGWTKVAVFNNKNITRKMKLPEKILSARSTCSAPCGPGEAEVAGTQKCCWHCIPCSLNEYVFSGNYCRPCDFGHKPNETLTGCEPLPIRKMEYQSLHSILALGFGILGLICTTCILVIFIRNRETAIVRASGKELCFFVLFGVFATLLNCFTVMSPPAKLSCALSRIILCIGPSCMYVGLLMKTIRVVFIFQSKGILSTKTKQYLQPVQFTLITVAVASVQLIVAITWLILKRPHPESLIFEDFAFSTCKVLVDLEIFIGLVFPFLIIIICTILATVNRNVPTGFRETLYVGFTMYTTCVIWLAFLPIFLTNSTDIPKKLTTVSIALSLSAITILLCLFGPRCFSILFHPEFNTTESVMSRDGRYSASNRRSSTIRVEVATSASVRRTRVSEDEHKEGT